MDNTEFPLYFPDNDAGYKIVHGEKIYYLNLIFRLKTGTMGPQRYRIVFNRNGIQN